MAALSDPAPGLAYVELHDLRALRAPGLDTLLDEESIFWREALDWDFANSASLVRKFVEMRALNGYALVAAGQVVGYCYFVFEDRKGLIGDLYVTRAYREPDNELLLLRYALRELMRTPDVHRIESQLMTFTGPPAASSHLQTYPRDFLSVRLPLRVPLPPRSLPGSVLIVPWQELYQEPSAHLIASAYQGHVDGLINDQYRSVAGSRKFLSNIVQYPGCGNFLRAASLVAFDHEHGSLAGLCLASVVGPESGHITQICVARDKQGKGLGYELLRQCLEALRQQGMKKVSLTVTSRNEQALNMYLKMGFTRSRHFAAYVWEGF